MRDLIAVGFPGTHRAAEVLDQLQELNAEWTIDLADAVAVYRTDEGKLRTDQSVRLTSKEGAAWGAIMGGLLGALLAVALTAGAGAAAAAAAVGGGALGLGAFGGAAGALEAGDRKDRYGVPEDFVKQVGGMVKPGTSALFAMIRNGPTIAAQA